MTEEFYLKGDLVYQKGDPADALCFVGYGALLCVFVCCPACLFVAAMVRLLRCSARLGCYAGATYGWVLTVHGSPVVNLGPSPRVPRAAAAALRSLLAVLLLRTLGALGQLGPPVQRATVVSGY